MEMQSMTEDDYARTLNELDRLPNDPSVPLQPGLIWQILDRVAPDAHLACRRRTRWDR
jgi:hypothetical protein